MVPALRRSACGVFVMSGILALAAPERAGEVTFVPLLKWQEVKLAATPDNETMLYDAGPMIFLLPNAHDPAGRDWLKFETDECGMLQRVDNSRSIMRQSAVSEDMQDFDEDDRLDSGKALVGQWLSQHSEIAVMNDGVDKSCDDNLFDDEDDDEATFEIA